MKMKGIVKTSVAWAYLILVSLSVEILSQESCDVVISSLKSNQKNGTFQSPGYPGYYPNNLSCKYKFIGREKERVKIQFTTFALQGRPTSCKNDFVNIYSQLLSETDDLLDAEMTGPFCGESHEDMPEGSLPSLIVSTHNVLVIWFYSNEKKNNKGFKGTFEFIDGTQYDMGTQGIYQLCTYVIRSENKQSGYIVSPTYPGAYPDNLFCHYKLQGKPGQRIKITFRDFALFYGGEYCPFDYVRFYDGHTSSHPVIDTFCGSYNESTVIYSTGEALSLDFKTGQGRLDFQSDSLQSSADFTFERRGFNLSYEFNDSFIKLDFIKAEATHIRGTLCDQRIMSQRESNGTITSPRYPAKFPEGAICRYILDGMMDDHHLEKVKITFFDFDIPGNMPYCEIGYIGENVDGLVGRGSVKDKYCGSIRPNVMTSSRPRMILILNTIGAVRGGFFLANYQFITDYGVIGKPIEEGQCMFHFNSGLVKEGQSNSPRYPSNYPTNLNCEYVFNPLSDEMVFISFSNFKLAKQSEDDAQNCARTDHIAIYEKIGPHNTFVLTERHCGEGVPGPYASSNSVKIEFISDSSITSGGFRFSYKFAHLTDLKNRCSSHVINGSGIGGIIRSPSYPSNYPALTYCEWQVEASRMQNNILIEFPFLSVEGKLKETMNCENAVLKIYNDSSSVRPHTFLCGKSDSEMSFISSGSTIRIVFLTSAYAAGSKGFKISWTEVHRYFSENECMNKFLCVTNKYCIASKLKCNSEPNCGKGDYSDETAECCAPCLRTQLFLLIVLVEVSKLLVKLVSH